MGAGAPLLKRHSWLGPNLAVLLAGRGVDDFEVLLVVAGIGPEGKFDPEELLHANQQFGVLTAESLEGWGGRARVGCSLCRRCGATCGLSPNRGGAIARSTWWWRSCRYRVPAVLAVDVKIAGERLLPALAFHLQDAELGHGQDVVLGFILHHATGHLLVNVIAVAALLHVD